MRHLIPLIPLLPLVGFVLLFLFGKRMSKQVVSFTACGAVLGAFVIALCVLLIEPLHAGYTVDIMPWIHAGNFHADISFLVDPLSVLFLLVITGVGFLIHLYSAGYMHEDENFSQYFCYLNLFIFFMTLLVLGDNFLVMFVGWEGVGFCSYLLIGFWFKTREYNNAAVKAFVMNRIGDLGFLLGIFLIFITFGSVQYSEVFAQINTGSVVLTVITLLLFVGAMGKSAQIPLYTWLPDAMAGPTPVSALIHAATMVTAGIYMIARTNVMYSFAPVTLEVVAWIGISTALLAASIGLVQNDIKKVLAYSTVSQLGLMFVSLGTGAYTAAVFHVFTHAFFKALLFLGAGAVIHALHGEQDLREMGGLRKHLPVTAATFLVASLAIAGIPPFAGFFSKDEILMHLFAHHKLLWFLASLCSALTAYYVFRVYFLTFSGTYRGHHDIGHLHKAGLSMSIPLVILAMFSVCAGFLGIPSVLGGHHVLHNFLHPVFVGERMHHADPGIEILLMGVAVMLAVGAILTARYWFVSRHEVTAGEMEKKSAVYRLLYHKYYLDELYESLVILPLHRFSRNLHRIVEYKVIDGIVEWTGDMAIRTGAVLRYMQTGKTGFYLLIMAVAIALLILSSNFHG